MARLALLLIALLALGVAGPAVASAQSTPFGPLQSSSTPAPTATPVPTATPTTDSGTTGRTTLFAIGGLLLVGFAVIGAWIARDARRALPESARAAEGRLREEGPHRHRRDTKARARQRGRAQRAARRRNR